MPWPQKLPPALSTSLCIYMQLQSNSLLRRSKGRTPPASPSATPWRNFNGSGPAPAGTRRRWRTSPAETDEDGERSSWSHWTFHSPQLLLRSGECALGRASRGNCLPANAWVQKRRVPSDRVPQVPQKAPGFKVDLRCVKHQVNKPPFSYSVGKPVEASRKG